MLALLTAVWIASLLGSLHCVGMCGGLVAFSAGSDLGPGARRMAGHAAYQGGRLLAYVALGVSAGALGAVVDLSGAAVGLSRGAAIAAGAIMVASGAVALLEARGVRVPRRRASGGGGLLSIGSVSGAALSRRTPVVRAAALGLASALLPCGWLWAFVATAAGTGSPLRGAAVMTTFWLGAVPALVLTGIGLQALAAPLRRHVPTITAIALLATGLVTIVTRIDRPVTVHADVLVRGTVPADPHAACCGAR